MIESPTNAIFCWKGTPFPQFLKLKTTVQRVRGNWRRKVWKHGKWGALLQQLLGTFAKVDLFDFASTALIHLSKPAVGLPNYKKQESVAFGALQAWFHPRTSPCTAEVFKEPGSPRAWKTTPVEVRYEILWKHMTDPWAHMSFPPDYISKKKDFSTSHLISI